MTVSELIDALGDLDPDLLVLVEGYEGGYQDLCVGVEQFAKVWDEPDAMFGNYEDLRSARRTARDGQPVADRLRAQRAVKAPVDAAVLRRVCS